MLLNFLISLLLSLPFNCENHDVIAYGEWGPYSKEYSGASHISDVKSGVRVDFTLVPGFYRRTANVPNELFENENGSYPWDFSSNFSRWTYRHEVEWKDRVFVDATYHIIDKSSVLLEMHCINSTNTPQELLLHNIMAIRHAEEYPTVSSDCPIIGGTSYIRYEPAVRGHNYALVYDGWLRGEKRDAASLTGSILETSGKSGDVVVYSLPEDAPTTITLRWKAPAGKKIRIAAGGSRLDLPGTGSYCLTPVSISSKELRIETISAGKLTIDALLLSEKPLVCESPLRFIPKIEEHEGWFVAKYDDDSSFYGMAWNYPLAEVNQYIDGNLDIFLRRMVHRHNQNVFEGDKKGHFTSLFHRPVILGPGSDTTIFNLIACGSKDEVEKILSGFRNGEKGITSKIKPEINEEKLLPGAERYGLGYKIIKANLLGNIVYPVWTQGQYIRHFTPGKNWNSLYTWDSGFICWAMSELNLKTAESIVRQYTTDDSSQSAFIHHGTPLPIHFLAYKDMLEKECASQSSIAEFYPRLKRYFDFMAGTTGLSTTRLPSGLLRTWDYFYNSGGWDDYPPQHDLRFNTDYYKNTAPMVQTSFYIRAAKIMRMLASNLGKAEDVKYYDSVIKKMSSTIKDFAWDPACGYYSYVVHDSEGKPASFYRYKDGTNFNMGLDGVSPLIAGICNKNRTDTLLSKIFSPDHLWTKCGISTVDQSAPYYTLEGYWNGCVWMPHQFVLWKTMLDLGRPDLAEKIAETALNTWENEVDTSYRSFEHFMITSNRGKGWHNFSGLSTPIVNWFSSYYKIGSVSSGFDVLLKSSSMSDGFSNFNSELLFDKDAAGQIKTIILCMNPDNEYEASFGGKPVKLESPRPGLLYLSFRVPESRKKSNNILICNKKQ